MRREVVLLATCVAALFPASAVARAASPQATPHVPPGPPVVVTTGHATVRQAPDRAFVVLATETRAPRPQEAQQKNAEAMTAVRQKLAGARLPADAIRTLSYSLQEESDWVNGKRVPRGYRAVNLVEVRLDDITRVGEIIDAGVTAGAASVSDIRFELKDRDAAERQAVRLAVADARALADAAAAGAGVTLGPIVRIEAEAGRSMPPRPPMPVMAMRAEADAGPPTPVSAGEIEVQATATLTVSIR